MAVATINGLKLLGSRQNSHIFQIRYHYCNHTQINRTLSCTLLTYINIQIIPHPAGERKFVYETTNPTTTTGLVCRMIT